MQTYPTKVFICLMLFIAAVTFDLDAANAAGRGAGDTTQAAQPATAR